MPRETGPHQPYAPDATARERFLRPWEGAEADYDAVYWRGEIRVGSPERANALFTDLVRNKEQPRTIVIGGQLGDEGKGRLVDNQISSMFQLPHIDQVHVIRYQGGNNAGHTVEHDGQKLALHQVPSGVFYTEALGIMDRGMVINVEDLQTEVGYVEDTVGDTRGKLVLSKHAIHNTDLDRATEWANRKLTGKAEGGTSRGIGPSYAGHYDRTGTKMHELMDPEWRKTYGAKYDVLEQTFKARGFSLADVEVPDFRETVATNKAATRTVGGKEEFLDRLEAARAWLEERDMVQDTITIHRETMEDISKGVIFEGSQAVGLDAWLGTYPDVTASDTTAAAVKQGTAVWKYTDAQTRMAVIKHNPSSVGARRMPTHIDLPRTSNDLPPDATPEQLYTAWVRETANERGTTTGRWRDMNHFDLAFLSYNLYMGEANCIGVTHLDVQREDMPVKVATHYVDKAGNPVPYKPDLTYLENEVTPVYVELPGWSGEACKDAKRLEDLPENAQKYLAFIQRRTGVPIVAVTTGPGSESFVNLQGNTPERKRKAA